MADLPRFSRRPGRRAPPPTVATFGPRQRAAFAHFGENIAELFKLAALLVFGALISLDFLACCGGTPESTMRPS